MIKDPNYNPKGSQCTIDLILADNTRIKTDERPASPLSQDRASSSIVVEESQVNQVKRKQEIEKLKKKYNPVDHTTRANMSQAVSYNLKSLDSDFFAGQSLNKPKIAFIGTKIYKKHLKEKKSKEDGFREEGKEELERPTYSLERRKNVSEDRNQGRKMPSKKGSKTWKKETSPAIKEERDRSPTVYQQLLDMNLHNSSGTAGIRIDFTQAKVGDEGSRSSSNQPSCIFIDNSQSYLINNVSGNSNIQRKRGKLTLHPQKQDIMKFQNIKKKLHQEYSQLFKQNGSQVEYSRQLKTTSFPATRGSQSPRSKKIKKQVTPSELQTSQGVLEERVPHLQSVMLKKFKRRAQPSQVLEPKALNNVSNDRKSSLNLKSFDLAEFGKSLVRNVSRTSKQAKSPNKEERSPLKRTQTANVSARKIDQERFTFEFSHNDRVNYGSLQLLRGPQNSNSEGNLAYSKKIRQIGQSLGNDSKKFFKKNPENKRKDNSLGNSIKAVSSDKFAKPRPRIVTGPLYTNSPKKGKVENPPKIVITGVVPSGPSPGQKGPWKDSFHRVSWDPASSIKESIDWRDNSNGQLKSGSMKFDCGDQMPSTIKESFQSAIDNSEPQRPSFKAESAESYILVMHCNKGRTINKHSRIPDRSCSGGRVLDEPESNSWLPFACE